ncbi:MAG: hypothetical protein KDE46_00295 [Caldilineaceae bacterium]|nr:hypothetical protein [Caldilineaceae bacterium]
MQSEKMAAFINELLDNHPPIRSRFGLQLVLTQPGHGCLVVEELTPIIQMRVAYVFFDRDGLPKCEPELLFWVGEGQWIPFSIRRTTTGCQVYGELNALTGEFSICHEQGQAALVKYTDWFAQGLHSQGWIENAYEVPDGDGLTTTFTVGESMI